MDLDQVEFLIRWSVRRGRGSTILVHDAPATAPMPQLMAGGRGKVYVRTPRGAESRPTLIPRGFSPYPRFAIKSRDPLVIYYKWLSAPLAGDSGIIRVRNGRISFEQGVMS
jgi:hypothetical protein